MFKIKIYPKKLKQVDKTEAKKLGRKLGKDLYMHPIKAFKDIRRFNLSGKRIWKKESQKAFLGAYEKERKKWAWK